MLKEEAEAELMLKKKNRTLVKVKSSRGVAKYNKRLEAKSNIKT